MLVYKVCSLLILTQRGKCHRTKNTVNVASGRRVKFLVDQTDVDLLLSQEPGNDLRGHV